MLFRVFLKNTSRKKYILSLSSQEKMSKSYWVSFLEGPYWWFSRCDWSWWIAFVVQLNPPCGCQWWTEILTILSGLKGWGGLLFWWDEPWSLVNQYCWWETLGNLAFYAALHCSAVPDTDSDAKQLCRLQCFFDLGHLASFMADLQLLFFTVCFWWEAIASFSAQVFNGIICIMYNYIEIIDKVVKLKQTDFCPHFSQGAL